MTPAWLAWEETRALVNAFAAQPEAVRFVGGAVRDAVLEKDVSDVDAATTLLPEATMAVLAKAGIRAIPTGIAHGTVTALVGEKQFEITTLRKDVACDGRHAHVEFTNDWKEDAARRDFTMNALYLSAAGELFDYFGGVEDAKAGRVRFIGDAASRITEDYLRILRFFRFYAYYGKGEADAAAQAACGAQAVHMAGLSGERIQYEMFRLLIADTAGDVVALMEECGVWLHVVPVAVELRRLQHLPQAAKRAGLAMDAILALAALLYRVPETTLSAISERWKLSRADYRRLVELCRDVSVDGSLTQQKKWIRTKGKGFFMEKMLLQMADGTVDEGAGMDAIARARAWEIPVFPVSGDDLVAAGIAPGKKMGEMLRALEEEWEKSDYGLTKEELLKVKR